MFAKKADASPAMHAALPNVDRPSWVKVGVIAALGFAVGIAWPRIAGVRLGPTAPETSSANARAAEAPPPSASASAPLPPPPSPAASLAVASSSMPKVTVSKGFVLSCKHKEGETLIKSACGSFAAFDAVAQPRMKKLELCQAADGISGKLAIVLNVDFVGNHIAVDLNKQTTVAQPEPLIACVRNAFQGVALTGIDHEHPRYSVLYSTDLKAPPGAAPAQGSATPGVASAGAAGDDAPGQVVWGTALVRDAPKTGQVVARLLRGAKIKIGAGKDGWFKIKYGPELASDGFVYREAIGK